MAESGADTKRCNNCKREISMNNFMMHEMHCKRHISLCQHCREPIPKGELEIHYEENHAKIACQKCGQQVEKMFFEEHEENTCPKKPTKCHYCELEFPKSDLQTHLDYCGSRTEPCVKCGQYIMLKDELKHEDSNCKFPVGKPANNDKLDQRGSFTRNLEPDYLEGLPMSRFGFDEPNDIFRLHPEPRATPGIPHLPGAKLKLDTGTFGVGPTGSRVSQRPNGTVKETKRPTAGRKADLNKQRETVSDSRPAVENDYDRLLAMHLAQDLNPEDDVSSLLRPTENVSSPFSATSHEDMSRFNTDTYTEDVILIPCEFCSEPFTADDLVQHQSGCSLDRISSVLSKYSSVDSRQTDGDNTRDRNTTEQLVPPPPILDSLRNFRELDWIDDTVEPMGGGDEAMLLPCEFCSELFPIDMLVQHQAMCDTSVTPRVVSPVEIHPKQKRKTPLTNTERLEADLPNLASRRHQPPPFGNRERDSDEENSTRTTAATHRIRKPLSKSVLDSSNITPTRPAVRKIGAETHDRGDRYLNKASPITQTTYARQSSNSKTGSNYSDIHLNTRTGAQVVAKKPATTSKTRSSFDGLLGDSDHGSHDLLGHINVGQKSQKNDVSSRRVVPTQPAARGLVKTKPPTTTTRERDLNKYGIHTTSVGQPKPRLTRPQVEVRSRPSDIEDDGVASTRQRTRANHVFGAATNSVRRRPENS